MITAQNWKMKVDLQEKLTFSTEIITTSLRPDRVLCSASQKAPVFPLLCYVRISDKT